MTRSLPSLALALLLLAAAGPAAAEAAQPLDALDGATLVPVGAPELSDAEVRSDGRVRFRNEVPAPTRLIFDRRDADALTCETDRPGASRSRPGQYVIAAGGELVCTLREGDYRFATYTQRGGAIESAERELRIR